MPGQTETRLPWGQDTITIKGRNAGIDSLTVFFDDEQLNIADFLNNSSIAEYAALYEAIMAKYEAKLKSGNIFDHNFPETKFPCKKIDTTRYKSAPSLSDKELIEALLREYRACLDDLKAHFKQYEAHVERWYNSLPTDVKTKRV
jgi:hypothetical protein